MTRYGLLIGGVLGAALLLAPVTLSGQQPAAGAPAPACADPLHTSGPCPAPAGQPPPPVTTRWREAGPCSRAKVGARNVTGSMPSARGSGPT
jgi:hypothetical protein